MSNRPTLSLRQPPPADSPKVELVTPEQVAEFLKAHGLVVMPAVPAPAQPATAIDWKYDAPVVVEHNDYSNLPPAGDRASAPITLPPKTWGNPNLLRPDARPGPQPASTPPRGR